MAGLVQLTPATDLEAKAKNTSPRTRKVLVRDLILDAQIGVYEQEKGRTQKVRINIELHTLDRGVLHSDNLRDVVCYQDIIDACRIIVTREHVHLVETLAEHIAKVAFLHADVLNAQIRVEKLEAVPDASSVGVEITRVRGDYASPERS